MHIALVYRGPHLLRQALDLEVLAPLLRGAGHRVSMVYDPDTFGVTDNVLQVRSLARRLGSPAHAVRRLAAAAPQAVLFSVVPGTYRWALDVARGLSRERPDAPLIFSGLHPTLAPAQALQDEPSVSFVLQGELEQTLPALLAALESGGDPGPSVDGLWTRGHGGAARFTRRAPLTDLDRLPLPDKELFAPFISHRYSYVAMVSRGCTGRCTFCEESCLARVHARGYFRRKAVDTVMAELTTALSRHGFQEVIFKDSYLSGDEQWLGELMQRYRREVRRPFKCFCRIRGFSARTARLLREGGCYCVEFGLQTWNEALRREVLRRRESNEEARQAFARCAEQGLWYDVDHMFNLPGEQEQDHREGAAQYRALQRLNRVKVHFLVYLPTAEIVAQGRASGDLPQDAEGALARGGEGEFFFRPGAVGPGRRELVAGYANLYRLLPLLPARLLDWLLQGRARLSLLGRIPPAVTAALMGLGALRSRDLRFAAYLRIYPRKALFSVLSALCHGPWGGTSTDPHAGEKR